MNEFFIKVWEWVVVNKDPLGLVVTIIGGIWGFIVWVISSWLKRKRAKMIEQSKK